MIAMNYAYSTAIVFANDPVRISPSVIHVEPWGEEYTLLPGEECELVAYGNTELPSFYVVALDHGMQVYCNHTSDFEVLQAGQIIYHGHNSGVTPPA